MKILSILTITMLATLASGTARAAPQACDGGVCSVSAGASRIDYATVTAPRVSDDGFGFKRKLAGGLTGWQVEGSNRMFAQYSYFRIGNEPRQRSLADPAFEVSASADQDTGRIRAVYDSASLGLRIELSYTLQTGVPGHKAQLLRDVRVSNRGGAPVDLSWFDYSDLDVDPSGVRDSLASRVEPGGRLIEQNGYQARWLNINQDGRVLSSVPAAYQLAVFGGRLVGNGGAPSLLDLLQDTGPLTLSSTPDTLAQPEDMTYAVQFNFRAVERAVVMRQQLSAPDPATVLAPRLLIGTVFGRVLRYEGRFGAYMGVAIPSCLQANVGLDCSQVPGLTESPVAMALGPDGRVYTGEQPVTLPQTTPSGLAVKRYDGVSTLFNDPARPDPYAALVPYGSGGLGQVGGLAFGPDNMLYVSDKSSGAILGYDSADGSFLGALTPAGTLDTPGVIRFGADGNAYVMGPDGAVQRLQGPYGAQPGAPLGQFIGPIPPGQFSSPASFAFGPDHHLYRVSYLSRQIMRFQGPDEAAPGQLVDIISLPELPEFVLGTGLAFNVDGQLLVSAENGIFLIDPVRGVFLGELSYAHNPTNILPLSLPLRSPLPGDFAPVGAPDGCIGRADLNVLLAVLRSGVHSASYDLNGDGSADTSDARKLVLLFTHPDGSCP